MAGVVIYQPSKSAMQSGRANLGRWLLAYETESGQRREPLMGWVGSGDTKDQVRLSFSSAEAAVAFARKEGLAYRVLTPKERRVKPKNYSDNFL